MQKVYTYLRLLRRKFGFPKDRSYIYTMIKELLEKRDLLSDIAEELYGEFWVAEEAFWGSPTELEMREVQDQLITWGWEPEQPTDDEIALGEIIFEEMQKKGRLRK